MTAKKTKEYLDGSAREILRLLRLKNSRAEIVVLKDGEMNALRAKLKELVDFKGREAKKIVREKQVSVLSFPEPKGFPHPENGKKMMGEVYLNKDFARGRRDVILRLLIHGILHLAGYEHEGKRDTIRMEKREKEIFKKIF